MIGGALLGVGLYRDPSRVEREVFFNCGFITLESLHIIKSILKSSQVISVVSCVLVR